MSRRNKTEPPKRAVPGQQVIKRAPISRKTAKIMPVQRSKGNDKR